jgi:sulfur carrier protein
MNGAATFSLNGKSRHWAEMTLVALLEENGVDVSRGGVAVARNGEVVPRPQWAQTAVQPDDKIEIVHIVRGG